PTRRHSHYIASPGTCGKTRAVPQNRRSRERADGLLRVGFPGDRPDAGRGRRRQGREPGGAFADRRPPRAGWLLRDDGRLQANHGGSAVDRRSARSAVAPEAGRPGGDPRAQRGDPPDPRRYRNPRRSGGGDYPPARPARRASRLRRPIQCDGGGLADGLLRGPAGHLPERRGAGGDPPARQPVLGLALHRAGRDLPPAERPGPPEGSHGGGRAADGLPAGGRHSVHGRPRAIEWCLVDDDFLIVQSRPITTLFPVPEAGDRENHVYISVGHQQMMTDPIKPLGISVWQLTAGRPMYEAGGRLFVDVTRALASPASSAGLLALAGKSDPLIGDALQTILERGDFIPSLPDEDP